MVNGNRTNPPDSHRTSRRAPERENRPVATATRERTAQSQPRPKRGCPVATATEEREPSAWCCSRVTARGGGTHQRENRPVATATRERTPRAQPRPKRGCPVATATEEREPSAGCCDRILTAHHGTHQRENRPVATATEVGPPSRNRDRRERTLRVLLLAAAAGDTHLGEAFDGTGWHPVPREPAVVLALHALDQLDDRRLLELPE